MSLRDSSTGLLSISRHGEPTTSLGNLLKRSTMIWRGLGKTFFLISNLSLPGCNSRPIPLVPCVVGWRRGRSPPAYSLLSGSDWERWALPGASCSPGWAPQLLRRGWCAPDSSPAWLPFSGHAPVPQWDHRIIFAFFDSPLLSRELQAASVREGGARVVPAGPRCHSQALAAIARRRHRWQLRLSSSGSRRNPLALQ